MRASAVAGSSLTPWLADGTNGTTPLDWKLTLRQQNPKLFRGCSAGFIALVLLMAVHVCWPDSDHGANATAPPPNHAGHNSNAGHRNNNDGHKLPAPPPPPYPAPYPSPSPSPTSPSSSVTPSSCAKHGRSNLPTGCCWENHQCGSQSICHRNDPEVVGVCQGEPAPEPQGAEPVPEPWHWGTHPEPALEPAPEPWGTHPEPT